MENLSRRVFLRGAGAATLLGASELNPPRVAAATTPSAAPAYTFLNPQEARFVEAAVARLIPLDERGPGAIEAGVPNFIDKQLGGAWGAGERLYRAGPWKEGTPSQGYQLPFTPSELFRNALRAVDADLRTNRKKAFDELTPAEQDAYLTGLQNGGQDLNGVPSKVFFESLLAMTIEGYFSDPVYGGNHDMASWRMIGFPGAYAGYYHLVDQHGVLFDREPMSLGDNGGGVIHLHAVRAPAGEGGR
jgi:gluconate 2-dehydrogenase gamma chain